MKTNELYLSIDHELCYSLLMYKEICMDEHYAYTYSHVFTLDDYPINSDKYDEDIKIIDACADNTIADYILDHTFGYFTKYIVRYLFYAFDGDLTVNGEGLIIKCNDENRPHDDGPYGNNELEFSCFDKIVSYCCSMCEGLSYPYRNTHHELCDMKIRDVLIGPTIKSAKIVIHA